ncbi:MAG: lipopolysaccharide assembly protein LapA domain-containing protein [Motilibacteraceae bacterium]
MVQRSPGTATSGTAQASGRRVGGGAIAGLTGVGVLLIFMIQNTQDVTLHFLVWSFTWPLWLFTVVMAVVGALTWVGAGVVRRHRRRVGRRAERSG